MDTHANASTTQGPAVGSEEWVAQTLNAKGLQGDAPDASEQYEESQDAYASDAQAADDAAVAETTTAPSWREAAIPVNDDTVPQHFRGKPVAAVYDSYRELERQFNEDRKRLRELEAKVAARETFKEILAEQHTVVPQPVTPVDPYRAAGIDLETDPVLNPTRFFPKQEEVILGKASQMFDAALRKRDEEAQAKAVAQQEKMAIGAALARVEKERGLNEQQMRARIPSMMMSVAEKFGREALRDPEKILAEHDAIFGAPVQVVPATQTVPNPPGSKRPVTVDAPAKAPGPQLKGYEREILSDMQAALAAEMPNIKIDPDRLAARYAARLKRERS